ncbi:phage protein NinX family protein [Rheinheimera hassiensis]|uniref:phage protein NinX family protein n=1 Tax=Rheinheimera hassiensis TaxID=1193627 RepID=UPI001F06C900|nr:phage protein NinX family protein [Rheinheimera hassiensis]
MRSVNVSELTGEALDWAVATCEGLPIVHDPMGFRSGSEAGYWIWDQTPSGRMTKIGRGFFSPSTNWAQAGAIIEREKLSLASPNPIHDNWCAMTWCCKAKQDGNTALIAAMRCYVQLKLGLTIDVPSNISQ